jgi:hypothetical protein
MIKIITLLLISSYIYGATGRADNYKCITDYMIEPNGQKNRTIPQRFKHPNLGLTTNRPEIAILAMANNTKMFEAKEYINDTDYGKGISYQSNDSFLDIYSNGKVVFGIIQNNGYRKTIKMYCTGVNKVKYLKK